MAKRLDEYVAAGAPSGVPPPRRSGILQGTHAALDRYAELLREQQEAAPVLADVQAAESLIASLTADPPAPLTAELAGRYRAIVERAVVGAAPTADSAV